MSPKDPSLFSARRVPVSELSINRLERLSASPGGSTIRTVLDNLDFPAYKVITGVRHILPCCGRGIKFSYTWQSLVKATRELLILSAFQK